MKVVRTPEQIEEQFFLAQRHAFAEEDAGESGGYGEGAYAVLQWLTGNTDMPPMDNE